jgi:hypothetical protein
MHSSALTDAEQRRVAAVLGNVKLNVLKILDDKRFTLEDVPVLVITSMSVVAKLRGFSGAMKKETVVQVTHRILDSSNLLGQRESTLLPVISGIVEQSLEVYDGKLRLRRDLVSQIRQAGADAARALACVVTSVTGAFKWVVKKTSKCCEGGCACCPPNCCFCCSPSTGGPCGPGGCCGAPKEHTPDAREEEVRS